jgi:hypothetical protein
LREADAVKYRQIHKGIPFYFMSWLAFDLRNYEKALFYIDAGISEDVRKNPKGWQENPGHDSCSSIKGIRPLRVQFSP